MLFMANIFLAYRFTGEDPKKLEEILDNIRNSLQSAGHNVCCTFYLSDFFKENKFSNDQIYEYGLKKVDENDIFLAFVKSSDSSKGMNSESKRAIKSNKKYILAIQKDLDFPEFRSVAHDTIEYDKLNDLYSILSKLKF